MEELGRLITAMVTPFDNYGQPDYPQARRLASALLDSGSDGVIVSGTTGESHTLSTEEKLRLFGEIKDEVGNTIKDLNLRPRRHSKYLVGLAILVNTQYI